MKKTVMLTGIVMLGIVLVLTVMRQPRHAQLPQTRTYATSSPSPERARKDEDIPTASARNVRTDIDVLAVSQLEDLVPFVPQDYSFDVEALNAQREFLYRQQDAERLKWPGYTQCHEEQKRDVEKVLDLADASTDDLCGFARAAMSRYWENGGPASAESFRDIYAARLVLEMAHAKEPQNDDVTDLLVDVLSAGSTLWYYDREGVIQFDRQTYVNTILPLRMEQRQRLKAQMNEGRMPGWDDFVRSADTIVLLAMDRRFQEAEDEIKWTMQHIVDTGRIHPVHGENLLSLAARVQRKDTLCRDLRFSLYRDTKFPSGEELVARKNYYYRRRLPSFRGPDIDARGVKPLVEGWTDREINLFRQDIRDDYYRR